MSPRPLIPNRRELILLRAEELLLEVGFDAMTMQELARRVGIGKGSIYREFASKDDLLDAILATSVERVTSKVAAAQPTSLPRLSLTYRAFAEALVDEPVLCAAFLDDGGVLGSQVNRSVDGRYRRRHDAVIAWIEELQAAGSLAGDVSAPGLALALSSATLGLLTAAKTLGPLDRNELVQALGALEVMVCSLELPRSDQEM